ncbi:MAG: Na/Pi symporter [Bacteroidota bacterium]|nr:Na/Pi symporter [Bacteroidota bacterium]
MIWIKWFLSVLGGLGVFLFGMRTLSDAIRRASATPFRQFLSSVTQSTWVGTVTGFFVTSLIQSSSAVTVTLVSLVNAGLLTIRESVGVLLGTNVGTTITAWLIVLSLGGFSLSDLALPLAGLAVPLLLLDRRVPKQIADIVFGFALLFIGLDLLKDQMAVLGAQELFATLLPNLGEGLGSNVLFLMLGAGLTALIQSSSAATALTLAALVSGVINLEHALAMVLGENIGTTLTANLAAVVGNRASKRVARIHFLINALGSVWMVGLIPLLADGLSGVFAGVDDPEVRSGYVMASFHTTFNVFNGLLMSLLSENLVSLSKKLVWSTSSQEEVALSEGTFTGRIVDARLTMEEVLGDFRRSGGTLKRMVSGVEELLGLVDPGERSDVLNQMAKWGERTSEGAQLVSSKLEAVAQEELSPELSARLSALSAINPAMERVGDALVNMSWQLDAKGRQGVYFLPKQRTSLIEMLRLLKEALTLMDRNLRQNAADLDAVADVEGKINALTERLREKHLRDLDKGKYPASSGVFYNDLVNELEKCGDRVASVATHLASEEDA